MKRQMILIGALGILGGAGLCHADTHQGHKHKDHADEHDEDDHDDHDHEKHKHDDKHRHHEAHEHGVATLDIVLEKKTATAMLRLPSEGLFGFEHQPKSDKDKKTVAMQTKALKDHVDRLVIFDPDLGCKGQMASMKAFEAEKKGSSHSETTVRLVYNCKKPIVKTKIGFGFSRVFSRIRELKVQLLSDAKQTGKTIRNDKGTIEI